jgi:hypothetical protein
MQKLSFTYESTQFLQKYQKNKCSFVGLMAIILDIFLAILCHDVIYITNDSAYAYRQQSNYYRYSKEST